MTRRILLAYDGSNASDVAADFAADLTRRYDAELHVLAVLRPPEFGDEVETKASLESARRHMDSVMEHLRTRFAQQSTAARFHVAIGHPAEQIVRFAEQQGVDHIVVGHRGHSMFERWLIGSVARQVIAYAHCVVTVVRK